MDKTTKQVLHRLTGVYQTGDTVIVIRPDYNWGCPPIQEGDELIVTRGNFKGDLNTVGVMSPKQTNEQAWLAMIGQDVI